MTNQLVDGARRDDGVAVQHQHQRAVGLSESDVVRAREPDVRIERDQPRMRPVRLHGIATAVVRGVVYHDDLVARVRRRLAERLQAALQIDQRVVAHDQNRQLRHRKWGQTLFLRNT